MEKENEKSKNRKLGIFSALAAGVVLSLYAAIIIGIYFGITHGWLAHLWKNLEGDGRANIISSLITAVGILSSAIILPFVFKDRIASLDDMVRRTESDLSALSNSTSHQLKNLTDTFLKELQIAREQSKEKAEESQELVSALYAAVTTTLGQGKITDDAHAKQIVHGLWEKARFATRERINNKKNMYQRYPR